VADFSDGDLAGVELAADDVLQLGADRVRRARLGDEGR
jgi:hypothetical protein